MEQPGQGGAREELEKKRIFLVDNHRMVLEGLRHAMGSVPDFEVSGEALEGHEALKLLSNTPSDVVIVNTSMKGLNGIETARQITHRFRKTRVVGVAPDSEWDPMFKMLVAGAMGYVLSQSGLHELVAAVRSVLEGRMYLCRKSAETMTEAFQALALGNGNGHRSLPSLTSREKEVLQGMTEGKTSAEMAAILCVSVNTVENHRRNIVKKLKTRRMSQLTKYAILHGLTTLG